MIYDASDDESYEGIFPSDLVDLSVMENYLNSQQSNVLTELHESLATSDARLAAFVKDQIPKKPQAQEKRKRKFLVDLKASRTMDRSFLSQNAFHSAHTGATPNNTLNNGSTGVSHSVNSSTDDNFLSSTAPKIIDNSHPWQGFFHPPTKQQWTNLYHLGGIENALFYETSNNCINNDISSSSSSQRQQKQYQNLFNRILGTSTQSSILQLPFIPAIPDSMLSSQLTTAGGFNNDDEEYTRFNQQELLRNRILTFLQFYNLPQLPKPLLKTCPLYDGDDNCDGVRVDNNTNDSNTTISQFTTQRIPIWARPFINTLSSSTDDSFVASLLTNTPWNAITTSQFVLSTTTRGSSLVSKAFFTQIISPQTQRSYKSLTASAFVQIFTPLGGTITYNNSSFYNTLAYVDQNGFASTTRLITHQNSKDLALLGTMLKPQGAPSHLFPKGPTSHILSVLLRALCAPHRHSSQYASISLLIDTPIRPSNASNFSPQSSSSQSSSNNEDSSISTIDAFCTILFRFPPLPPPPSHIIAPLLLLDKILTSLPKPARPVALMYQYIELIWLLFIRAYGDSFRLQSAQDIITKPSFFPSCNSSTHINQSTPQTSSNSQSSIHNIDMNTITSSPSKCSLTIATCLDFPTSTIFINKC